MKQRITLLTICLLSFTVLSQNPLAIPDTLSGSEINLTLQTGSVQFMTGNMTNTMGVNGDILGPTLILNRFQNVTLNVNNELGEPSTIHWHGMHVAPENDGGPHIVIPASTTWSPSFQVLDHASTYWYHPHLHMNTNKHVQKGIAGMIIVRDAEEQILSLPRKYGVDDFPVVVQSKAFDSNNQIIIESALDSTILVNGTIDPFLDVPAQWIRLRLLNGSSERYYNFGFTGNLSFQQIGSDGGLLDAPVSMSRLQLAPGERAEIVIDLSALQGQSLFLQSFGSELPSAIYGAAQPGMGAGQTIPDYSSNPLNGNDFNVLQLNIVAPTSDPVLTISSTLTSNTPWLETEANITRSLLLEPETMGPTAIEGPFLINNTSFDMEVINYIIPYDNIEIWSITNQSPIGHPFHMHDINFYILDINGVPPPSNLRGRKDVIHIPAGGGNVRFITKFEDFTNDTLPYMYHCHILTHEDGGMMGQFVVSQNIGLEEEEELPSFTAFPNPAENKLTLFSNSELSSMEFTIYDQCGRIITNGLVPSEKTIDLSYVQKGYYLLKLADYLPVRFVKK